MIIGTSTFLPVVQAASRLRVSGKVAAARAATHLKLVQQHQPEAKI
jgi:hypothetical protein